MKKEKTSMACRGKRRRGKRRRGKSER